MIFVNFELYVDLGFFAICNELPRPGSVHRCHLMSTGNQIMEIRLFSDCNMGLSIPVR